MVTGDTHANPRERHRVVTRRCYDCGAPVRIIVEHGVTPGWRWCAWAAGAARGAGRETMTPQPR